MDKMQEPMTLLKGRNTCPDLMHIRLSPTHACGYTHGRLGLPAAQGLLLSILAGFEYRGIDNVYGGTMIASKCSFVAVLDSLCKVPNPKFGASRCSC